MQWVGTGGHVSLSRLLGINMRGAGTGGHVSLSKLCEINMLERGETRSSSRLLITSQGKVIHIMREMLNVTEHI